MYGKGGWTDGWVGYPNDSTNHQYRPSEQHVRSSRAAVQAAKEAYQSAISRRSASQREVNELLQRKHAWSAADLERFTSLYRSDHANEQAETQAAEKLAEAERTADEAQAQLARSILARYHEEQIWSDKIRRASTWGTWGLMGFNVLLFIVVQLGLEPWKRRRLVGGFEEKVREVIQQESMRHALMEHPPAEGEKVAAVPAQQQAPAAAASDAGLAAGSAVGAATTAAEALPELQKPAAAAAAQPNIEEETEPAVHDQKFVPEPIEMLPIDWKDPNTWIPALKQRGQVAVGGAEREVKHYFSEEKVTLTQNELTQSVLEGAMIGAFMSALVALLLSGR